MRGAGATPSTSLWVVETCCRRLKNLPSIFRYETAKSNHRSGDRVETALMKWMATPQALHSHPDSLRRAVPLDGLPHILRAARMVAAGGGQPRRHPLFIYAERAH